MNTLICGASGFIGSYLTAHLIAAGDQVTACTRNVARLRARFSQITAIYSDFNTDITIEQWLPRLKNIDLVINCAGILTGNRKQNIAAIHYHGPFALYQACVQAGVKRVIHISALGVERDLAIDYVTSKKKLDQALLQLNLNAVVLRPSLIYAAGAYGGSSFMRGLSALPLIPLIGQGEKRFQPISMPCLLNVIDTFKVNNKRGIVNVVGPESLSFKTIISKLRRWLGLNKPRFISIPIACVKWVAKIGDVMGGGPVTTTSFKLLMQENIADDAPLKKMLDFPIKSMDSALQQMPSQVQDLQHARLYFMAPLARFSLVLLWGLSGLIPLTVNFSAANNMIIDMGFPTAVATSLTALSCAWDIIIALWLSIAKRLRWVSAAQLVTILSYTAIASISLTSLWLNPLGPLLKNIPILVLVIINLLMEQR